MLDAYFPFYAFTFILTFLMTVLTERQLIPLLSARAKQPIYREGPGWHIKKSGTPTLGGLAFLAAALPVLILAPLLLKHHATTQSLSLTMGFAYALLNAFIGIADDLVKLGRRENEGLTPRQKLILQFLVAGLYLWGRHALLGDTTTLAFSFGTIDIGFWYYPLSLILLVGIVNCANLTDGIDGLAASVAFGIGVSLFYISAALSEEVGFLAASMMGISVGFLCFNLHPAKIFMGDTGSLFLGALAACSAFALGNPLLLLFFGAVYVLEGISVILQVIGYKLTGRRMFRMAPLHHHFEKLGWSENRICLVAMFFNLLCSVPAYILYLP